MVSGVYETAERSADLEPSNPASEKVKAKDTAAVYQLKVSYVKAM
jgi:hypothetical protein